MAELVKKLYSECNSARKILERIRLTLLLWLKNTKCGFKFDVASSSTLVVLCYWDFCGAMPKLFLHFLNQNQMA